DRNIGMADKAEEYLAAGQKTFFAVGTGHMVGEGGIADLLTQRGYTVEKIPVD
ncbi:MAG: TraB/GumN family protein, partial [Clostridia bacterium]|nr:TraB/GumN family protein [Clostridia bacterium]